MVGVAQLADLEKNKCSGAEYDFDPEAESRGKEKDMEPSLVHRVEFGLEAESGDKEKNTRALSVAGSDCGLEALQSYWPH